MRKTLLTACLLIATSMQAQVLHVNNSDGTYQAIDTKSCGDITFNEDKQLINIGLDKENSIISRFFTGKITNIAPASNQGNELTYTLAPSVTFDAADKENFNEITQAIPTDELDEEYGDFIENYSTGRMVTITFSENGVKASGRKKVYIMLGMNDVYLYGVDKSIENAKKLVAEIKQKSPGVEIFIQSVTPVIITKKGITNKLINKFNKKLSECCKEQKWNYLDVASVLKDKKGALPVEYCSDPNGMGIHFTDKACKKWVEYLYTHTK